MAKLFKHSLPHSVHHMGLYYGWVVLVVGTYGILMSVPGQTIGISVFTESLIENLGVKRVDLSAAYMLGTISSSFFLPYVGKLLDRVGSRVMAVFAAVALSLFLIILSYSLEITSWIHSMTGFNREWMALAVLFFSFMGVRHFGQGQLTMISRTMIGRWFGKRRGLIMGISGLFVAFGFGIAPLTLTQIISKFQWQGALHFLALLLLIMAVIAFIFYRHSPESCGLKLDGGMADFEETPNADHELPLNLSFTVEEAKITFTFWAFNFGTMMHACFITATTFHIARIGGLEGIPSTDVFKLFLPLAIVSTSTDLVGGLLSDRVPMKYLLCVMQLGLFGGLLGLNFFGSHYGFWLTAIGFGISSGLFSLLVGASWPRLFGRTHLGAISGYNMAWIVFGSAIGPFIFGLSESLTGGFFWAVNLSLIIPILIGVSSFWANQPLKKS